jgi:hypothetical protein
LWCRGGIRTPYALEVSLAKFPLSFRNKLLT